MTDTAHASPRSRVAHRPPRSRAEGLLPHVPRWAGLAIAAMAASTAGWLSGLFMPRGPITGAGVVVAMITGIVVGVVAGVVMRSRWAILVTPLIFVVAYEISRLGTVGPSVDRPDLSSELGVYMLVLGRGFHGVVGLVPIMVGAAVGAGLARRIHGARTPARGWREVSYRARQGGTLLLVIGMAGLAALLTRPGSTDPIVEPDGTPVPGSVAELTTVQLGGHEQTVLIRGRSVDNPVVLYLSGGPGQSDLGYTRSYMTELEEDFVFVVWDQRGSGTSYAALDPTDTWTLDQAVADTVALTRYLRDRFGQEKIYLFGNSWGSILGVLAVQSHPALFHAYIGAGQMASPTATDQALYDQILDYAERTDDADLAARMRAYGPPPYEEVMAYGLVIQYYDRLAPYPKTDYFRTQGPPGIDGAGVSEYGPLDKINKLKAIADMGAVMYPQLQQVDFRTQVPQLDVPVYLTQGAHELAARSVPTRQWFDRLAAPHKEWITFADSGHVPQFEEFPRFHEVMVQIAQRHG